MKRLKWILLMLMASGSAWAGALCNPPDAKGKVSDADCGLPPWVVYCSTIGLGLPCNERIYNQGLRYGAPSQATIPAVAPFSTVGWGFSHAEVAQKFGAVQVHNFQTNPDLDAQFNQIDPGTLSQLSSEIMRLAPSTAPQIFTAAATRLNAGNLVKMRSAFGPSMDPYIAAYAPPAVLAAYRAVPRYPALPFSYYSGAPLPLMSDMTLEDLYLDAFTAGSNETQTIAVQKAVYYTVVVFHDKAQASGLSKIGNVLGPISGAISFFMAIADHVDPNWYQELTAAIKQDWNDLTWPGLPASWEEGLTVQPWFGEAGPDTTATFNYSNEEVTFAGINGASVTMSGLYQQD